VSLTPEDVEEILKILDTTDYDELHLETDRFVLSLRRDEGGWTEERQELGASRLVAETGVGDQPRSNPAAPAPPRRTGAREGLLPVLAPLPGVLYRAPKPGEPPFVEIGDRVEHDTIVAIIETMKLMSSVRAGAAGTVAEFVVANGEPAVQGAVLLWLAPDGPVPSGP
jgi:acetyl-CoA carboxylase biotin carboxyl carrier protein